MKRSEINAILRQTDAFIRANGFHLPPFAYWTPQDWAEKGPDVGEIPDRMLGWDITDFGLGDFQRQGLVLFTLRNGDPAMLATGQGKLYAEKLLICAPDQITPLHYHWRKVEDIINRGGGRLVLRLFNSTPDGGLADTDVAVSLDGVQRTVAAGGTVTLNPGESITLPTELYHAFWAEGERVLVGEVSTVNDDNTDNRFYEPIGRFAQIEEDEAPLYLLCNEVNNVYRFGGDRGSGTGDRGSNR